LGHLSNFFKTCLRKNNIIPEHPETKQWRQHILYYKLLSVKTAETCILVWDYIYALPVKLGVSVSVKKLFWCIISHVKTEC